MLQKAQRIMYHSSGDLSTCTKDNLTVIFTWRYDVFVWKLTWYFIAVYNKLCYVTIQTS